MRSCSSVAGCPLQSKEKADAFILFSKMGIRQVVQGPKHV